MLEGMNYLHAKYQINIFRNKKVIKLLELWTLWKRKEKKRRENSEYKRVVITTLKMTQKRLGSNHESWLNQIRNTGGACSISTV